MLSSVVAEVDFIEELRLRRWAREHYVPRNQREVSWHPVILDEMDQKDYECGQPNSVMPKGVEHADIDPVYTCA